MQRWLAIGLIWVGLLSHVYQILAFRASPWNSRSVFSFNHHRIGQSTAQLKALETDQSTNQKVVDPSFTSQADIFIQDKFITAVRQALRGDQSALDAITSSTCLKWDNPFVSTLSELKSGMSQFSSFFQEPTVTLYNSKPLTETSVQLDYQLSFWYPLPWRPRIIIPATAVVTLNPQMTAVTSVAESWQPSPLDIFLKQIIPRLWDIWHLFTSPVPEYPPAKALGKVGKVSIVEFPPTLVYEARWTGLAKYPGPPVLTIPGFALTGDLRTSRPNRDPFYTVLPVETCSDSFVDPSSKVEMKTTSWIVPVPTAQQDALLPHARTMSPVPIQPQDINFSDSLVDDVDPEQTDYKVNNLDKVNIMKSVTMGAARGTSLQYNEQLVEEFRRAEKTEYLYRLSPRRVMAQVEIKGDVTPEKISKAINEIREAMSTPSAAQICSSRSDQSNMGNKNKIVMKKRSMDSYTDKDYSPQVGLMFSNCKACFNGQAQLAMAIYEIQWKNKRTQVQVELESIPL